MRLDHLLSKEQRSERKASDSGQQDGNGNMVLFNFEGPEKGTQKSETLCEERGGVAQLGEHLLCTQGVRSSNLLISTKGDGRETRTAADLKTWAHSSGG